jgi:hypothetical protein
MRTNFDINNYEKAQIEEWENQHNTECPIILKHENEDTSPYGTIAGGRTYSFTPTSIGVFITVKCCCGAKFTCDSNL